VRVQWLAILLLISLVACNRQSHAPPPAQNPEAQTAAADPDRVYEPSDLELSADGIVRLKNPNTPLTGILRSYYPDGQKRAETTYLNGRKHGEEKVWHPNGQLKSIGNWEQGLLSGPMQVWNETGTVQLERVYENGRQVSERTVKNTELTLDEKERKLIWEFEHHGNILNKYALKAFQEALESRDPARIATHLSDSFSASLPVPSPADVTATLPPATAARWDLADGRKQTTNAPGFLRWMSDQLAPFDGGVSAKFSLISFAPIEREKLTGRWKGNLRARFWGKDGKGRPAEVIFFADLTVNQPDKEKLPNGRWLHSFEVTRLKHARSESYLMEDIAAETGIPIGELYDTWTTSLTKDMAIPGGVYVCDFNQDGFHDLLVSEVPIPGKATNASRLYIGQTGGVFQPAGPEYGLKWDSVFNAAFADLDNDGWEDLIINDGRIFRNLEGRKFEEVTKRSNLREAGQLKETGLFSQFAIADYDRDGDIDIYIFRVDPSPKTGSWIEGHTTDIARNALLRNNGNWRFEDVTRATGTDGGLRSTFSSVWMDYNNDQWPDLYVINEFGTGVLLVNREGRQFTERPLYEGISTFGSMGLTCGDVNNDGFIDLYVAKMFSKAGKRVIGNVPEDSYDPEVMRKLRRMVEGSELFLNQAGHDFKPVGKEYDVAAVGWAYAPAFLDLDNDGFLDLHATAGFISRTRSRPDG